MGNADSTQKLGERVLAGKAKLEQDKRIQSERYEVLKVNAPSMLDATMKSIEASFKSCSPFLEPTLLIAWIHDAEKCKKIVLNCCRKVLSEPINNTQYEWFNEYVFTSSIWMFKTKNNTFMYEELFNIAKDMSHDIINSMDSIYKLLTFHSKWDQVMNIKNTSIVLRQDHASVGLLQDKGFKDLSESKTDDEKIEDMKNYMDTNLAINILSSTAKNIHQEFQNHIKTVMGYYGAFRAGPLKKVERCVSKVENDYQNAKFPKCAKLLDIVRCSVTFNTIDQLLNGYNGLIKHINKNKTILELARIKNKFLDVSSGGYRDIKICVIYKSQINPEVNMICEIQLLLINYLQEKKRIHKLYTILREEIYFQMVAQQDISKDGKKDITDLKFTELLNVTKDTSINYSKIYGHWLFGKCSMNSDLGLLALEGANWFGIVDMKQKKSIFEIKRDAPFNPFYGRQSHSWITINNQKYVSVQISKIQIKMFKVIEEKQKVKFIIDENYTITLGQETDIINYCCFDKNFEIILLIVNYSILQKRSIKNVKNIAATIKLKEKVSQTSLLQLNVSSDGRMCAVGAGVGNNYFYVYNINQNEQYKMTSNVLTDTFAPCWINGETKYISVSDYKGRVEIWDFINQKAIKIIKVGDKKILASTSIKNILAVGGGDRKLSLYNVTNWECFYTKKCDCIIDSLHLTADLKYLTIGGREGPEPGIVLEIE